MTSTPTIRASGAIPAYACVKMTSTPGFVTVATAATDTIFGVNGPNAAPNGEPIELQADETDYVTMLAGGAITSGNFLVPTTGGAVVSSTVGQFIATANASSGLTFSSKVNKTITSSTNLNFLPTGTGVASVSVSSKLAETLSIKDFGAVGDGTLHTVQEWFTPASAWYRGYANLAAVQAQYPFVTGNGYSSDLAAINKALLTLSQQRQSPPAAGGTSLTGWGMGEIFIPRGKYIINNKIYVNNGTSSTTPISTIGVRIRGEGMWASNLIYTPFTGDLFDVVTCLNFHVSDLCIINDTAEPSANWTSNAFKISSVGGGKLFQMDRCFVRNFNVGIRLEDTVNNDTNKINNCWFEDQNTFLYTRNSQAVINEINSCTLFQSKNNVFDIAGFGYTTVSNCDIIPFGTVLNLAYGADLTGTSSQYTFINTKFEFWPQTGNAGTTKIVVAEDNQLNMAHVRFFGCGMAGSSPDPNVFQWDISGGKITIDVRGGDWSQTKIRTKAHLGRSEVGSCWINFTDCTSSPSTTITRVANASDGLCQHIPVSFKNCRGIDDICLKGPGTANNCAVAPGGGIDRNFNSKNANGVAAAGGATFPTGATTHAFGTSGSPVLIDKIRVVGTSGAGGVTEMRLQAFSDAGLTTQIGSTVTKTTGFTTPFVMEITDAAGKIATNGIWVRVWQNNVNTFVFGTVFVDTVSF